MGIPGKDRVLVLCSDHVNDLLETEQKFKEHYNINRTDGKICRMYGFDIYEYDGTPYYNMSTGKSWHGAQSRQPPTHAHLWRSMPAV